MITGVNTLSDLNVLKEKWLASQLSPAEFVSFMRLFSNGEGDYTEERKNYDITEEEFLKYIYENEGIDVSTSK